jgi:hypothetical protein
MTKWVWPVALAGALLAGWAVAAPVPQKKGDSPEVKALLKERRDALAKAVEARSAEYLAGRGTQAAMLRVCRELLKVKLELAMEPAERIAAHEEHFNAMRKFAEVVKEGFEAGRIKAADHFEMHAARLEAEIGLRRAGGKPKEAK